MRQKTTQYIGGKARNKRRSASRMILGGKVELVTEIETLGEAPGISGSYAR